MYYVYILCCGDASLYTGITNDLEHRLKAHQSGKGAKYTRSHLPVALVYAEAAADKSAALKRELEIKTCSRREKLTLILSVENPYLESAEACLGEAVPSAPVTDAE